LVNKSKKTATNEFYKGLEKLSKEDEDHPENYISLEEILKKYPITEKTDDKGAIHEKRSPKHCPNCGSINIHNQELESRHPTSELYDAYCRDCQWSGDISPDIPLDNLGAKQKRKKPSSSGSSQHEIHKRNNQDLGNPKTPT
jgi:hypothetical protein